jgi:hypothetical protein
MDGMRVGDHTCVSKVKSVQARKNSFGFNPIHSDEPFEPSKFQFSKKHLFYRQDPYPKTGYSDQLALDLTMMFFFASRRRSQSQHESPAAASPTAADPAHGIGPPGCLRQDRGEPMSPSLPSWNGQGPSCSVSHVAAMGVALGPWLRWRDSWGEVERWG